MSIEKYTKRIYDQFGKAYQQSRDEHRKERLYNEFLEVPCMLKAVGNIRNKHLLDIGCGAGVHVKRYLKKGAKAEGIDLSQTMIALAQKNCPGVMFKVGTITKLPYKNSRFDIVTASLIIDYVKDLDQAFAEVSRVLRKGGLFFYSDNSPISGAREIFENKIFKIKAVGYVLDKKTGSRIPLGSYWHECLEEFEMLPGMTTKYYKRMFRTHLTTLRNAGLELVDFIDCKPVPAFKRYDPESYALFTKFPLFSIYVCQKK
ncbi:MAG: class I SAM-dependent methyltransferase [Nanoarchaeota archaeon]